MAFKRLYEAKSTFNNYCARLTPQQRKKHEDMYTEKKLFELKEQTALVCYSFSSLIRFANFGTVSLVVWEPAPSGEFLCVGEM
jgi:hypothetical protein